MLIYHLPPPPPSPPPSLSLLPLLPLLPPSQLHPVEVARQLTLIQSEYFRAIHTSELVDASWMKEAQKETASPNLLRLNRFETNVSTTNSTLLLVMFLLVVVVSVLL